MANPLLQRLPGVLPFALLAGCSTSAPPAPSPTPSSVSAVADEYYRDFVETRPLSAFVAGVPEAALDRYNENSLAALARWTEREDGWLARLRAISESSLAGTSDAITYAVLRNTLESAVGRRVCRDELWSVSQQGGPQQLPGRLATSQPVGTDDLRAKALARYRNFRPWLRVEIANLREGVRQGYVAPRIAVENVIDQLDGLVATPPDQSPILALAERDSTPGWRDSVVAVLRDAVYPAFAEYREYLRTEYLPKARAETALAAMPHGAECYRARVRSFTTLDLDPKEIHRTGLEQIERLEAEARPIAERLFGTADMSTVWRRLREDPAMKFSSRQEVLDTATAALARARAALPQWFGRLPKAEMVLDPCLRFEEKSGCPIPTLRQLRTAAARHGGGSTPAPGAPRGSTSRPSRFTRAIPGTTSISLSPRSAPTRTRSPESWATGVQRRVGTLRRGAGQGDGTVLG